MGNDIPTPPPLPEIKPPILREAKIHADNKKFEDWLVIHGFECGTYVCVGRLPVSSKIGDQYLFINRHGMIVKIPYEEDRFEFLDPLP